MWDTAVCEMREEKLWRKRREKGRTNEQNTMQGRESGRIVRGLKALVKALRTL